MSAQFNLGINLSRAKVSVRTESGRSEFWRWDSNQRLMLEGITSGIESQIEVHYSLRSDDLPHALVTSVYEEDGCYYSDVPNVLLQSTGQMHVYLCFDDGHGRNTADHKSYFIKDREKPEDYLYGETETQTYHSLNVRVTELERIWDGLVNYETEAF